MDSSDDAGKVELAKGRYSDDISESESYASFFSRL